MNKQLQEFARSNLKAGIAQLPESNQVQFKRMYSHTYDIDSDGRSYAVNNSKADLNRTIDQVVDAMPEDKLDWAMQQVDRSLQKLGSV